MKKILAIILSLSLFICCFSNFNFNVVAAVNSEVTFDNTAALPTDYGKNLLAGISPMVCEYKGGENQGIDYDYAFDKYQLTDGDVVADWHNSKNTFAKEGPDGSIIRYQDGTAFYRMTFRLKRVSDISNICLIHHKNKSLITCKYEVYASNSTGDLYSSDKLIASVDNPEAYRRNIISVKSGAESVVYFGIKIIDPVNTDFGEVLLVNYYPRICEISVYGQEGELVAASDLVNSSDKTEVYASYPYSEKINTSQNKLSGKYSTVVYNKNGSFASGVSTNASPRENVYGEKETDTGYSFLTDNNSSTTWYTSNMDFRDSDGKVHKDEKNYYVDIFFDAGTSFDVGMIYLLNHSNKALRMEHYQIWVTNNSSDYSKWKYTSGFWGIMTHALGDAQMIADIYNRSGVEEQFFFSKGELKARYFLIRVYNPCHDVTLAGSAGLYPRLSEFSVYSKEDLSGYLDLSGYTVNNGIIGPLQQGNTVADFINSQKGRGEISVFDFKGDKKGASALIGNGDSVISHTGYDGETATIIVEKDINSDGRVTVSDTVELRKSILKREKLSEYTLKAADSNSDNATSIIDVVAMANYVLETDYTPKEVEFPKFGGAYGVHTDGTRRVSVDTNNVINDDFAGVGTNVFPAVLTAEGRSKTGYNDVFWALEQSRMNSLNLSVARSWFQIDWMIKDTGSKETDKQCYLNGDYDLESEWMQAFYEYALGLKNMDCDLLVNFGWKTNNRIASWFASPNQKADEMDIAAPGDLPAYAKATAAFVDYARNVKGLDNVKYLSFYNEPNGGHDFQVGTDVADERVYWAKMLTLIDNELEAQGLRGQVELWGPEISGIETEGSRDWWKYTIENSEFSMAGVIDVWDFHCYYRTAPLRNNYKSLVETLEDCREYILNRNDLKSGKCMMTEMYPSVAHEKYNSWIDWNDSFAGYYVAIANGGFSGLCTWTCSAGYIPAPVNMNMLSNYNNPWTVIVNTENADQVNTLFYEQSLIANYIPKNSKTLNTTWLGDDIRATAFEVPDGGYTVVVEKNGSNDYAALSSGEELPFDISINFGIKKNLSFNRFSFRFNDQVTNASAIVNQSDKQLQMKNGVLTDSYDGSYGFYIYTTLPPIKQVCISDITLNVKPENSVQVDAKLIDCESSDALDFEIVANVGSYAGSVSESGIYTADSRAKSGDMVAIKASLKSDPKVYSVAIITIN